MSKATLLKSITFGQQVAEQEIESLKQYFVDTEHWRNVFAGGKDVVYGAKGSGKSPIYLLLRDKQEELLDRGVLFIPAENVRGNTAFSDIVPDPPTSELEFVRLWKLFFLSLVGEVFREYGISGNEAQSVINQLSAAGLLEPHAGLRETLRKAILYVRSLIHLEAVEGGIKVDPVTNMPAGVSGKIVFRPPTVEEARKGLISIDSLFLLADTALQKDGFTIWLAVDRLDVAFADQQTLEVNALRALFKTYLDLQAYSRISLKIFLRTDIWSRITQEGFREASHITKTLTLSWSENQLLNLVIRRLLQSKPLIESLRIDPDQILGDMGAQKSLFYRVFPEQVEVGQKKPLTFQWLLGRTRDGLGATAPRELIHLLNEATALQLQQLEIGSVELPGETLYSRPVFKEALKPVSKVRLEQTLYAEYPSLKSVIQKLEGQKATQTLQALSQLWQIDELETLKTAKRLAEIGFFEIQATKEVTEYWVPPLYRDALKLVQGARSEDEEEQSENQP